MSKFLVSGSIILSPEELSTQRRALGIALANPLLPVTIFDSKSPHVLHIGDADGVDTSISSPRFTLGEWLQQLVPQFDTGVFKTIQALPTWASPDPTLPLSLSSVTLAM